MLAQQQKMVLTPKQGKNVLSIPKEDQKRVAVRIAPSPPPLLSHCFVNSSVLVNLFYSLCLATLFCSLCSGDSVLVTLLGSLCSSHSFLITLF